MAMCGVMRIEKRGRSAVYGLQIEANRTEQDHKRGRDFDRSDIDWNRTKENLHLVKTDSWNRAITEQIRAAGVKERKDSTVLIDGLYTASSAWFEQHPDRKEQEAYFRDCLAFHVREYCGGDSSRIINAVIHFDEKTPHLQVASVPIVEDEKGLHLSAKIICGGRADFRLHQDRFYEQVTRERGLERGEVREPAETKRHTTKREWQLAEQEERTRDLQEQATTASRRAQEAQEAEQQAKARAEEEKRSADVLAAQKEQAHAELERVMNMAGQAAVIKKPGLFKRGHTIEVSEGAYDDLTQIGTAASKALKAAEQTERRAAKLKEQVEQMAAEIKPLHEQAQAERDKAEQYRQEQEDYILGTARSLAQERIDEIMDGRSGSRMKRLERFCESLTMQDGRSVLEHFNEQEKNLRRELEIDGWER